MFYSLSFLLLHFPTKIALFLLIENKRDRLETLMRCAEWPQFVVDYFLGQFDILDCWFYETC